MNSRFIYGTDLRKPPAWVIWFARIALLTLTLQITAVGHWNFGPFHADDEPGALASHAAHCHGNTSACSGEPSTAGTWIDYPLSVMPPDLPSTKVVLADDRTPEQPLFLEDEPPKNS
jgi:hypothetical protein